LAGTATALVLARNEAAASEERRAALQTKLDKLESSAVEHTAAAAAKNTSTAPVSVSVSTAIPAAAAIDFVGYVYAI